MRLAFYRLQFLKLFFRFGLFLLRYRISYSTNLQFNLVNAASKSNSDWSISLQNKILMNNPHVESGSQDIVIITHYDLLKVIYNLL